ncbi:MAG: hypothetical protein CMB32_06015 [Euryarchaeota archaeon]|nr:hypothetical protein [Euryarchaeota archaeon]|tara:strand:+ start:1422 stop:4331 length:2910 start_codon:yes stop_codon:yes gene_type:complete
MIARFLLSSLAFSIVFISCFLGDSEPQIKTPDFLTDSAAESYADSVLAQLSTEERIAQLLMVPVYSRTDTTGWSEAENWVESLGLGGIIVMQGGPENQRIRIKRMQELAKVPLMVASDAEWGLGMRLDSTRSFPRAMTLGATGNAELVKEFGEIVGQSLRQTGVHVDFAPVIDVNSNPINPVIGSRSFGEDVNLVSELGWAYADGLQSVNILATAKHFPGHGDSDSDSHKTLPVINQSAERLDSVELAPFRHLFDRGVGAVMIAHLDVPALDSTAGSPSTLSPYIVDTLLRQEMGFKGLAFTDALSMKGFADFVGDRPRARDALLAGNDVLLFPGDPVQVIEEVRLAIENGELDSSLVADKCKRVLQAKFWSKADGEIPEKGEYWDPEKAEKVHRDIIEASITVLTNRGYCLNSFSTPGNSYTVLNIANKASSGAPFADHLKLVGGGSHEIRTFTIGKNAEGIRREKVQSALATSDYVVINFLETSNRPSKKYGVSAEALEILSSEMVNYENDWVFNLFANPYRLNMEFMKIHEKAGGLIVAYQDGFRTQEAVVNALLGAGTAEGKLPVTPKDSYFYEGDGLGLRQGRVSTLGWGHDSKENTWGCTAEIDSIVADAFAEDAMPGCRIVIAHKGEVVHDKAYGTIDGVAPVEMGTIYDLASITKVAATSICLMKLNSMGYVDLDDPLRKHIPSLDTLELGTRTVKEVLTHSSGLYPWIPFYREILNDSIDNMPVDTMYKRIYDCELKPAGDYNYSDLGYYLFHNMFNRWFENDRAIDSLSMDWIYKPLGLTSMGFHPLKRSDKSTIAPTEDDKVFRKGIVRGTVHDPGSHMLGGVCCHAGLFSDAHDLARLGQMFLNNGVYNGYKLLDASTLNEWTKRTYPKSENRRGIGFDKKGLKEDEGTASPLASDASFGHSGFTGTLLWVDPEYELVYVFLSNRTFPNAENDALITKNVRTEIHSAIMNHLIKEAK